MDGAEGLKTELTGAAKYGNELPAPTNEASTCDWIILPILQSLGYARHEIVPQATDGRHGRPDYTILPDTDHTWFVEAKAWNAPLESTQADQALNYAHANGRRWVLLTNGREWRLYDDRRLGRSEDRLVGSASLEETERCHELLRSLTRAAVVSERVEKSVASTLVRKSLDAQLRDPSSTVVKALHKALRTTMGMEPDPRDIVAYFSGGKAQEPEPGPTPPQPRPPKRPVPEPDPSSSGIYDVVLRSRGVADARGTWDGREIVVKAGSKGRREPVASYAATFAQKHAARSEANCRIEGAYRVVLNDLAFRTPSGAAGFLNARSTNGWTEWRLPDGRALDVLRPKDAGSG